MKSPYGNNILSSMIAAAFAQTYMVPEGDGGTVTAAPAATAGGQVAAAVEAKPAIKVNFDVNYAGKEISFHFKKDKELGIKRPTVTLQIPQATPNLIVDILDKGGKQLDLLLEAMNGVLTGVAREQVNADEKITQETLDIKAINWQAISELPPAARRGGGIPKETWEEFQKDYIETMPAATGKTLEQVTNAAKLFVAKLQPVKTNKLFLNRLKEQLDLWFTSTKNGEDFQECYEFLANKMEELLKKDDAELLSNI